MTPAAWTAADDAALRAAYARGGVAAAQIALPARSPRAIMHRAHKLHVPSASRWTAAADDRLRWLWNNVDGGVAAVARVLGRTSEACYHRAGTLGIRRPRGCEALTAAAARTGFSPPLFARILRWAKVKPRLAFARPGGRRLRRQRFVARADVDDAVARWLAH